MYKAVIGTIVIFATIIGLGFYKNAHADEILRDQAISPVYKIVSNGGAVCSATSIKIPELPEDANVFMTAKHCIDPEHPVGKLVVEEITDSSESTKLYDYQVVIVSKNSDLAGIRVDSKELHTVKAVVADTQVALEGDEVYSVGYPLGMSRTVTTGLLGQKERNMQPSGDLKLMQRASTLLDRGMSGGPLYQKTNKGYEIIGVASTKSGSNEFMSSFVTLNDIKNFIEKGE